jgi:ribosome-associated toxin RatA of RatAB toxin-antitoxin module
MLRFVESSEIMRIEQAQLVKAPRDQVFEAFTDYEAYPQVSDLFPRVTVTERAGNTVHLDMDMNLMGRKRKRTETLVQTPPDQVQVEAEMEGATNTTVWRFEPVHGGTLVTAVFEVPSKGVTRLLGPLAKRLSQSVIREWMQAFAKYVEAK